MRIPQVDITHQDAQIEINSQRAKVQISSQRPRFRLIRNAAYMQVDRRLPRMHIDRSQAYMMMGKGPVLQSNRQTFQATRQQVMGNIANISAEGTALMQIENGVTLADIAAQAMEQNTGELNISAMPTPNIDWESGYLNIDWTPGNMQMEWDVSTWVDIRVDPYFVEVRLVKHPEVKITVKYKNSQLTGSRFVDKYL